MPENQKGNSVQGPPAQVVVILKQQEPGLQAAGLRDSSGAAPAAELEDALSGLGVSLKPLFGESEHQVARLVARAMDAAPPAAQENLQKMASFYTLDTPLGEKAEEVAAKLNALDIVE